MRILVAGRSGQLAQELLGRLAREGHAVHAVGQPELDLRDAASIRRVFAEVAPDAVVNAAAFTAVDRAESERDAAFAVNAAGAGLLAETAARHGVPLLHVSTDYVFDGRKGAPYSEDDAPNPLNAYGASKLAGEEAVLAASPRSAVLRTSWVCGAHGSNFLKTMLRLGTGRDSLSVVADQHGAPTFTADLADAITAMLPRLQAAPVGGEAFGLFHFCGSPWTTWHGFAAEIFRQAALRGARVPQLTPISTADYPSAAQRPLDSRLDCQRIARIHGIARPDWHVSLSACLDGLIGPLRR